MYSRIGKIIIDGLFPRRCPVCHKIVMPKGRLICPRCITKIHIIKHPVCMKCGKEVVGDGIEYCYDCKKHKRTFQYGFSLLRYDDIMKESIAAIKYKNKREYLDFFSQALCAHYRKKIQSMKIDLLVPIPVHPRRKRSRGFNQAEVLAGNMSDYLGIPMEADGLIRIKNTNPQKQLDMRARLKNLESAFRVRDSRFRGKRILLVDDIYTTGSTMEACSRVLKTAGASEIYFVTICIGTN